MTIEEAVKRYLDDELYHDVHWIAAPKDAPYPRYVLNFIGPSRLYDTGLRRVRLQVSVYDTDRYRALELRESVYDILQRFKGYMRDVSIIFAGYDTGNDMYEMDTRVYHLTTDYMITYRGDD
jgi:hypothetical protein